MSRWHVAVALLCLSWLFFQGARGLYDPDEGRYAAVAVEMLRTGDWFTPHLNHELVHFTKPPLTYWILASSMTVLGEHEWALRLPSALALLVTILATWGIARRLVPADPTLPAVVQATSLLPAVAASLVTTDPLLAMWETVAVFGFVAFWWDRPSPRWALLVMWGGFGLAFLTKGPPGLLPLGAILVFAVWRGGHAALGRLAGPATVAIFATIALGWFGLQLLVRPDLLSYLVGGEVVGRVSGAYLRNPGWMGLVKAYLPVIVLGLFPWPLVAWRKGPDQPDRSAPPDARRFLLLWLLLPLAIFCASQSRLPLYLLPLTVPAALLLGRRLAGWRPAHWRPTLLGWIGCLVLLEAVAAFYPHHRDGRRFAGQIAALLSEPPSEVVFVDASPRWSLGVYLGCDVESVEVQANLVGSESPSYQPVTEPLPNELDEGEFGALYLVPRDSVEGWKRGLESRGWTMSRRGQVENFEVFATRPPLPEANEGD